MFNVHVFQTNSRHTIDLRGRRNLKIESQLGTSCNAGSHKQPQGPEQKQWLWNREWVTDTGFLGG